MRFNLSEWALRNRGLVLYAMIVVAIGGVLSYLDLARSEEDVLSYALFPQVARAFFEKRIEKENGISDELIAVITAAVQAHGKVQPHPLIRNMVDAYSVSAGIPAINPLIRNS